MSFEFFKLQSDILISSYEPHRRTWKGLHVYATDGDQYELPRSNDILNQGYIGTACKGNKETHYPFMYIVHCYDVLSGVTKKFCYSNKHEELSNALIIASELERNSVTLYDRYFFCKELIRSHEKSNSYFVARIKKKGAGILKPMMDFVLSKNHESEFNFEGTNIRLIKVKNPKTKDFTLFATNLPKRKINKDEILDLYALRWEVETANRDLSHTLRMGQWHSKYLNGILQELYASLWLMNQARIQMINGANKTVTLKKLFKYTKSNFKLVCDFIIRSLDDLTYFRYKRVYRRLRYIISITMENRKRQSRSYPRQIRKSRRMYPSGSTIPRTK